MRPPECGICGERFLPSGGSLVTFHKTERTKAWLERAAVEGFVGHPPNQEWFCQVHKERASQLSHLSLAEAIAAWDTSLSD